MHHSLQAVKYYEKMSKIEINNVYKIFGSNPKSVLPMVKDGSSKEEILEKTGHTVGLDNVSMKIEEGEIFVCMGLSGSGKSTLIRHLNRLIDPTEGEILVEGTDVMTLSQEKLIDFRRHKMSMVFQRFGLFPHKTVIQNVGYGLEIQGISEEETNKICMEKIEAVGLSGFENQYPNQLSGGMQQRVGLARALATNTDIMLMDEAFSALDPLIRSDMQKQLLDLQDQLKKTIVFITHDLDEALKLGDKIAILKDGFMDQEGTAIDILLDPKTDYVRRFVEDVNRSRVLKTKNIMESHDKIPQELLNGQKMALEDDVVIEKFIDKVITEKPRLIEVQKNGSAVGYITSERLSYILQK